ncbi:MAG: hypothetical protein JNK02_17300 [Planctomycetes bacterium]|nr:hypothetical protein [Planctomycetota bacterium]
MASWSGRAGASVARAPAQATRAARGALALCASGLPAAAAGAGLETFGPLDGGARVSQAVLYDQVWSSAARTGDGWTLVWSAGQDIVLRRFSDGFAALGGDTLVNTTLNAGVQDEPAIAVALGGTTLVAWSERHGYDGEQMGIFARAYGPAGAPLGPEFQVNQIGAASQWRPLVEPTPAGGFVVAWSGDWDGDAFLRVLDAQGAPLSPDVRINEYEYDAQVDPSVAVAPNGTIFAAFVDFSSHGGVGSGLNLWGRRFSALGAPLGGEFPLPATFVNGDQRLPRVGADGRGRFTVVWQDAQADGSAAGIALRRFDVDGLPLGPDLLVNEIVQGWQGAPVLAVEPGGAFLVAWEDGSTGVPRVRGRRFGPDGLPLGAELQLSPPGLHAVRPSLALHAASGTFVLGYDVWNGSDWDVHARRFRATAGPQNFCAAKLNSQGCAPSAGWSGAPSLGSGLPFTLTCADVINQKVGLLVYGTAAAFTPFQGGTLCVASPRRAGLQNSGGAAGAPDCSGGFAFDFNAWARSGVDPALLAGVVVCAQWYYRDVQDPAGFGSGLSNAVRFTLCP